MFNLNPKTTNKIKGVADGLKIAKAISNTLGTSPTETPDVDTKRVKVYGDGDGTKDNSGTENYTIDENGVGKLEKTPKSRIGNITKPIKRKTY